MNSTKRDGQRGSMFNFVIIGFILVACLVGLIYFVNDRGDQVRREQAIADAKKQAEEQYVDSGDNNESANADNTGVTASENTATDNNVASADTLPQTGIETSIGSLVGLYLLTVASTSYLLSRRKLVYAL